MVPPMCGMCVGWATGDASVRLLQHLNEHAVHLRFCTACTGVNILGSCAFTVLAALLLLGLRPLTSTLEAIGESRRCCGRSGLLHACAAYCVALCSLASQGLNYNVMMLWAHTFTRLITWGVDAGQSGTALLGRALLLWAVCLTAVGSVLTVRLYKWRSWLQKRQAYIERDFHRVGGATSGGGARATGGYSAAGCTDGSVQDGSNDGSNDGSVHGAGGATEDAAASADDAATTVREPSLGGESSMISGAVGTSSRPEVGLSRRPTVGRHVWKALVRIDRKLGRRAALAQLLVLLESTLAWVAGVAWTNAVVELSTQADYPYPRVVASDVLLALAFTLLAVIWIIATGQSATLGEETANSREAVERYYATYALSFIVGWSWIVVLRDLETLLADTISGNWQRLDQLAEAVLVFAFGPLLTLGLISTKRASFSTLCCARDALAPLLEQQRSHSEGTAATPASSHLGGGEGDERLRVEVRRFMSQLHPAVDVSLTPNIARTNAHGATTPLGSPTRGVSLERAHSANVQFVSHGRRSASSAALGEGLLAGTPRSSEPHQNADEREQDIFTAPLR